jgi:hypothetical protein
MPPRRSACRLILPQPRPLPIDEGAGPVKSAIFGYNASCLSNLELHAGAGWRGDARYARKQVCESAGPRPSNPRLRQVSALAPDGGPLRGGAGNRPRVASFNSGP